MGRLRIDLNADLGEEIADAVALLAVVTSANVACGYHAGSREAMRAVCAEAARRALPPGPRRRGAGPGGARRVRRAAGPGDAGCAAAARDRRRPCGVPRGLPRSCYAEDGRLLARTEPGALVEDPDGVVAHAVAVRASLEAAGFELRPFTGPFTG